MSIKRPRIRHQTTFQERLAGEAKRFAELAEQTRPGVQRDFYLRRSRQAAVAANIDMWLSSPGLKPPSEISNLSGKEK
jgi:hypothetical protein